MWLPSDIREGRDRIQDTSDLFHLNSRTALEQFNELESSWADERGRRFQGLYLKPQTELMGAGADLLRNAAQAASAAENNAQEAEGSLRVVALSADESEQESRDAARLLRSADDLARRASAEALAWAAEAASLDANISAAAIDPGW